MNQTVHGCLFLKNFDINFNVTKYPGFFNQSFVRKKSRH